MPDLTLELKIEARLCQRVRDLGGVAIKLSAPGARGLPDRLVILPGPRFLVVETKRPRGGRTSPHQMLWMRKLKLLGVVVVVARTMADIDAALESEGPPPLDRDDGP
jgi:hypothetical protein